MLVIAILKNRRMGEKRALTVLQEEGARYEVRGVTGQRGWHLPEALREHGVAAGLVCLLHAAVHLGEGQAPEQAHAHEHARPAVRRERLHWDPAQQAKHALMCEMHAQEFPGAEVGCP